MSRQPPIRPDQGSYNQFQLETSQSKPPYRRDKDILAKLRESIPQDEAQWQQARQLHRYATPEDVLQKARDILANRISKQDLRNFICIATCCVDWHLGRKTKVYDNFKSQISPATELTIQKYMSSARGVVQLLDSVYFGGLKHRAFECALLYARIGPSFLAYYNKDAGEFSACFPPPTRIEPEVQASLPLFLPFIIKYRHSEEYSYRDICEALGTYVLNEAAYARFALTLENGKPVPCELPSPGRSTDTSRDRCGSASADLEPDEASSGFISTRETFQLPMSFELKFKAFSTSEDLRRMLKQVQEQNHDQLQREVPGTPLIELQWTAHHDAVADQMINDLIQDGVLPRKPLRRDKSSYRHNPGSVAVPTGWIKIILPLHIVEEVGHVMIKGHDLDINLEWSCHQGFVLGERILLLTSRPLIYVSVSIPLSRNERQQ